MLVDEDQEGDLSWLKAKLDQIMCHVFGIQSQAVL